MIARVQQTHFDEKDVPLKSRLCGACKATSGAFHCHHRKNHPKLHPEGLGQALGNRVNMTEQDFILSHFVKVNQDVAKPGTSGESVHLHLTQSDSPSISGVGAADPPEPEANASTSKCSLDHADTTPE